MSATRVARPGALTTNILAVAAVLLPPALLLQRQDWILPGTGLGAGLGLVTAVGMMLIAVLLFAADMHPRVIHLGPVPFLLLLWALGLTGSYFAWSTSGLPQIALLATVGYGQSLAEVIFVLALMGALAVGSRPVLFIRILVACGALYGLLLLATSVSGQELAPMFRLPILQAGDGLSGVETERAGFLRPQGMAGHPLEAGALTTILAPLGIALARSGDGRARLWWWAATGALILGSLSTLSRSATVGLVVALAVMSLRWRLRTIALGLAGAVVAVLVVAAAAPERFAAYSNLFELEAGTDSSLLSRQVARDQAAQTIAEHFWAGSGIGSHSYLGGRTLDNQLLGFAVEQGVPVMLMFIALIVVPGWYLLKVSPELPRPDSELAIGLAGSLAALLVTSLVLDIFGFPQIRLLVFILLALVGPLLLNRGACGLRPSSESGSSGPP